MEFSQKREQLVSQLKTYNLSYKVLAAMLKVPRHFFIPRPYSSSSHLDTPINIGYGQTISAPHMVAIMCDLLELQTSQKILEIGSGSGYNAAVIAELVGNTGKIYSIERVPQLASYAANNIKTAGYNNVDVLISDGSIGLVENAPYDRICVTAAAPVILMSLVDQLKKGGKMVIPVGDTFQHLYVITKLANGTTSQEKWGKVTFVPLIGKYGFK